MRDGRFDPVAGADARRLRRRRGRSDWTGGAKRYRVQSANRS